MSRQAALPFLTLPEGVVSMTPWMVTLNDQPCVPLGDILAHWDYQSRVGIRSEGVLPPALVASALHNDVPLAALTLEVSAATGPGSIPRRVIASRAVELDTKTGAFAIDITIPGERLSHQLMITTNVVLRRNISALSPLAPIKAGSLLWTQRHRCRLESEEPRFPIEEASFERIFSGRPQATALWYLHFDPNRMDSDLHGALRLFLNSDRNDFVERIKSADALTLQAMLADVMSQLCDAALRSPDVAESLDSSEPGSLARHVRNWIRLALPGVSVQLARSICIERPGEFRTAIQAAAELSEDAA
jgi:hypothetical protein